MGYLEKNFILHERDEKGNLIPLNYNIVELGGDVSIIPASRGEILRVAAEDSLNVKNNGTLEQREKIWINFIKEHVKIPEFTEEDFKHEKIITYNGSMISLQDLLIKAIYTVSGLEIKNAEKERAEAAQEEESDLFRSNKTHTEGFNDTNNPS